MDGTVKQLSHLHRFLQRYPFDELRGIKPPRKSQPRLFHRDFFGVSQLLGDFFAGSHLDLANTALGESKFVIKFPVGIKVQRARWNGNLKIFQFLQAPVNNQGSSKLRGCKHPILERKYRMYAEHYLSIVVVEAAKQRPLAYVLMIPQFQLRLFGELPQ